MTETLTNTVHCDLEGDRRAVPKGAQLQRVPAGDDLGRTLRALYELIKWDTTTANSQPQRIVFLRSRQAKDRLAPALSKTNLKKTVAAPVVAILAFDLKFYEHLPACITTRRRAAVRRPRPSTSRPSVFRESTLKALFILAPCRLALGLDAGADVRLQQCERWTPDLSRTANGSRIFICIHRATG